MLPLSTFSLHLYSYKSSQASVTDCFCLMPFTSHTAPRGGRHYIIPTVQMRRLNYRVEITYPRSHSKLEAEGNPDWRASVVILSIFTHPLPCCQTAFSKSGGVIVLMINLQGPLNALRQIPHPQLIGQSETRC